jgi:hypothetical protein
MMKLALKEKHELARPLKVLAPLIKNDLSLADRESKSSMEHYSAAGEKLIEAKSQMPHGEWGDWLRDNFNRSQTQATRYMKLAKQNLRGAKFDSVNEMERKTRRHPAGLPKEIRKIMEGINVDVETLSKEDINEKKEEGVLRKLARQVIDAGYRTLSLKLHPDKGGSTEAMQRLNQVRIALRNFADGGALLLND